MANAIDGQPCADRCAVGAPYTTITQKDSDGKVIRYGCYERIVSGKVELVCFGCGITWKPKKSFRG